MRAFNSVLTCCTIVFLGTASAGAGPCKQEIMEVSKRLAATDAGSGPTTGKPAPMAGDQKGQHPGTTLMSKETEGKATSGQDVRQQSGVKVEASNALDRARAFDARGKEAECMEEVRKAKQVAGL